MKRLLALLLLVAGCRTWDVNAFGVPLGREPPRHLQASSELTRDETIGVIVVLTAMVGLGVAAAIAWDNCDCWD
jgi:hypothetical protein